MLYLASSYTFPLILIALFATLLRTAYGQRLQVFNNGDSENGVNIELTQSDCRKASEKGLGHVILEVTGRMAEFSSIPKVNPQKS